MRAGHAGPDVRNDCLVTVDPAGNGVVLRSTVGRLYGNAIRATVEGAAEELGWQGGIEVEDCGALDFCLRARLEAVTYPAVGRRLTVTPRPRTAPRTGHRRTRLYLPGNTPKFFVNASLYGADTLIFDLEDAVPQAEKEQARALVRHALAALDFGACERMVRVNRGEEGSKDLEALRDGPPDTLLVPKVESPADLDAFEGPWEIVPLLESALGVERAYELAADPRVAALSFGIEDYRADIQAQGSADDAVRFASLRVVNAARAAGKAPLGSVFAQVDDLEGFEAYVNRNVGLGFAGVGCLHPAQVPVAMRAFLPSEQEIAEARAILDAASEADGVVAVEGKMVDAPIVQRARRTLERAESAGWRYVR